MKKIRGLLCRWLGHRRDLIDVTIFLMKANAENVAELKPKLECRRCDKIIWQYVNGTWVGGGYRH